MVAYLEWLLCNLPCPRRRSAAQGQITHQFLALQFFFFTKHEIGEGKEAMLVTSSGRMN